MTGIKSIDIGILIFNYFVLFFAVSVMLSYIILAIISALSLKAYFKRNRFVNYDVLLTSDYTPHISIIAPAYNEGKTIQENVQSLLALKYNHFEVIVVNDGSKDDSIDVLKKYFNLVKSEKEYNSTILTKEVKAIYTSTNPTYSKLIVVDKYNGGKADALNTGINVSTKPYIVCIDVDCIMDKDALLKLAKPFMEYSNKRIIATGGVVRIANNCIIKAGKLITVQAPSNFLAKVQVLEYMRAFMLGRMAWAKMDGLLIISGAFGMFDREIVIKAGGYNPKTVGEDMELIVRMRRYMIEQKQSYLVQYIPDPLCWTEVPESFSILRNQRSRWTRGTAETLWTHRKMLLNPKYKILGLLSFPYWLIYEYLAPIIELIGLLITILYIVFDIINWKYFLLFFLLVYSFAIMFSMLALFTEELTYRRYKTFNDFGKFCGAALLEPFIFHPFTVFAALRGNWQIIKGTKGWGEMKRTGFKQEKK